jgi:hypothetical protein
LIIHKRNAPTKYEQYHNKKPAAATVFEDVVVLVEVTVYNPSRRCGLKKVEINCEFLRYKKANKKTKHQDKK